MTLVVPPRSTITITITMNLFDINIQNKHMSFTQYGTGSFLYQIFMNLVLMIVIVYQIVLSGPCFKAIAAVKRALGYSVA